MTVALPKTELTIPQFFAWWDDQSESDRYELVDGKVRAMVRDRIRHNEAKARAFLALRDAIGTAGVDCQAYMDGIGVSSDSRNFRLPDAAVNCGPVDPEASILPNPVIVVEVVSPTSEQRDVHEKLYDYFSISSIQHYLIVYPERGYVVHHARGAKASVEMTFVRSGEIELTPPGIRLSVGDLLVSSERHRLQSDS